jgi:hypothetical protein
MAMQKLSPVELEIVRSLLVEEYGPQSPFLDQLNEAYFDIRHLTGVGLAFGGGVGREPFV